MLHCYFQNNICSLLFPWQFLYCINFCIKSRQKGNSSFHLSTGRTWFFKLFLPKRGGSDFSHKKGRAGKVGGVLKKGVSHIFTLTVSHITFISVCDVCVFCSFTKFLLFFFFCALMEKDLVLLNLITRSNWKNCYFQNHYLQI